MQNFRALGAPPPDPRASLGWGLRSQIPQTSLIANFWLRACQEALVARVLNMNDITNIVVKCVNFIKKTGLSHHQF